MLSHSIGFFRTFFMTSKMKGMIAFVSVIVFVLMGRCLGEDCLTYQICDPNADCRLNPTNQRHQCYCRQGYHGDGIGCIEESQSCELLNNCGQNAECISDDESNNAYYCSCIPGFVGDGYKCFPELNVQSCDQRNNCHDSAQCVYDPQNDQHLCKCKDGYLGDGFSCLPSRTCREDPSICDRNADCVYNDQMLTNVCQCRYGFIGDGSQCRVAPRHEGDFLIFSQGMSLLRIPLQPTKQDKGRLLLTKPNQIPAGLDVDCLNGQIYWSDVAHGVIYRAQYNGSSIERVIEGVLRSPEGIAIDWVSRNIYWTDSLKDTIEVSRIDGKMHKTLISEGLVDPRGIVVHPGSGKMYWSDWNRPSPKIEMANLDGTERTTLVSTDLGLPNNLAIDYERNDLCWTDAGLHRIECIDLYSNNRRIVHTPTAYPFDLAIVGESIYWTDWEIKFIQKVHRNGGPPDPIELPLGGNGKVYSIVTIPRHCPRISNPCSMNNGGCRHLCLPNGRGRTCMCPDSDDIDSCNEISK